MSGGGGGVIIIHRMAEVVPDPVDRAKLLEIADRSPAGVAWRDKLTVARILWRNLKP